MTHLAVQEESPKQPEEARTNGPLKVVDLVHAGEIVPAKKLAVAWGISRQALRPAEKRGEVFSVLVNGQRFYPREFMRLDRRYVAMVCKQLGRMNSRGKLTFWICSHAALGGLTPAQVLLDGKADPQRVVQLAAQRADADA